MHTTRYLHSHLNPMPRPLRAPHLCKALSCCQNGILGGGHSTWGHGVAGKWISHLHSYSSTHDQSSDAASVDERGSNLAPPPAVTPMSLAFL